MFPRRLNSNLLNCSSCKCYANDRVSIPRPSPVLEGEGWAEPWTHWGPHPCLPPPSECLSSDSTSTRPGVRERPWWRERQREAPELVGRWTASSCHNHQHQNALWKRQIPPRLVPATLQLGRPRPPALGSWAGGWEKLRRKGEWGAGAGKRICPQVVL